MKTKALYKSEYLTVEHFPEYSLIISTWSINTVSITAELLQTEMLERMKYIESLSPKNLLVNSRFFFFKLPPAIQTWMNTDILKRYFELGIKKMAFVISEDLIAQVSIEQAIQEDEANLYQIRYFDTLAGAKIWLNADYN